MSAPAQLDPTVTINSSPRGLPGRAVALLRIATRASAIVGAIGTGVAGCVLTWEATARYLFKIPSDWQDEVTIFLLVGATFLSAAWVQEPGATSASRRWARSCRLPRIASGAS